MTRLHQLLIGSWRFRLAGILVLLWTAAVFLYATFAAWGDELDVYSIRMLFLLIVGLPLSIAAVVYAAVLAGTRWTVTAFSAAVLISLIGMANQFYRKHVRAEFAEQNRRVTELADLEFLKAGEKYGAACRTQLAREQRLPDARLVGACAQAAQLIDEVGTQQALDSLRTDFRVGMWLDESIKDADAQIALEAAKVVHGQSPP